MRAGHELAVSIAALLAMGVLVYGGAAVMDMILPAAHAEDAADALWRVRSTEGSAMARRADGDEAWYPVRVGQALEPGSEIKTDPSARVALVRGTEVLNIDPNRSVELPTTSWQPDTLVIQWFGEVIYSVTKRPEPSFEVDTPHLVAVVKGTKFAVKVDDDGSAVRVAEGVVSVAAEGNSASKVDVGAGSVATVLTAAPMDVAISAAASGDSNVTAGGAGADGAPGGGGTGGGLGSGGGAGAGGGDGNGDGDGDGNGDGNGDGDGDGDGDGNGDGDGDGDGDSDGGDGNGDSGGGDGNGAGSSGGDE
jgi:hypothetical protein